MMARVMGGWGDLTSEWPLLQADYGLHFPHALASRDFIRQSGLSAGYDPTFMAGFPMSVVSGTSSTLTNVAVFLARGVHPAVAFKFAVLGSIILAPILLGWAGALLGLKPISVAWSIAFYLVYFWTDFAKQYVYFGMVSFFLGVPLGLVAVATLAQFLEVGGRWRWLWAALACSAVFFVHPTSPMVVGPAGLLAYGVAWWRSARRRQEFPWTRHVGFGGLAVVILILNAFWWLPAYWLRSTVGETRFAFAHPESVLNRLGRIFWQDAPIEGVLIGFGLVGLVVLASIRPVAALGLTGMIAAGFGWGYLAGAFRSLDGLQPGRQTYACYTGLCVAAGFMIGELFVWVRAARPGRIDRWLMLALVLAEVRVVWPTTLIEIRNWTAGANPRLSSRPPLTLVHLIQSLKKHVAPGDRLLYEESGLAIPGEPDPFGGRHFSPVLPLMTGVEVLGGPYLHTPIATNFTQFGEERLFGDPGWGRDQFVRYARLYRPTAIACWTRKSRSFCQNNPDLIQVLADDGVILLGRVLGFEGATIQGAARVEAHYNELIVRDAVPDASGLVVLRYHATPCLVADPPLPIEPIYLEADPVPFIGLRPRRAGPIVIKMVLPPADGWFAASTPPPRTQP